MSNSKKAKRSSMHEIRASYDSLYFYYYDYYGDTNLLHECKGYIVENTGAVNFTYPIKAKLNKTLEV